MDKTAALLQAGDDQFRGLPDFVDSYHHPGTIDEIIERFALE
jgi:hypothetical protein